MKIKFENDNHNEDWHLGDVVMADTEHVALIVKDNDGDFCLMDLNSNHAGENFSTDGLRPRSGYDETINDLETINGLRNACPGWHKVNATLVIR